MRALIFGGTTEGRELAVKLADEGCRVIYSAATDYGIETLGHRKNLTALCGIRPENEIEQMLDDVDFCVDATHPFAEHISRSILTACSRKDKKVFRYVREEEPLPESRSLKRVDSVQDACAYLRNLPGNILLTTGSKNLMDFSALGPERLHPRVLPSVQALEACKEAGIPRKNIIAMQGPFSAAMNVCMIRDLEISYLVTKESGRQGGMFQKIEAAEDCGIELVMIRRPEELLPASRAEDILQYVKNETRSRSGGAEYGAAAGTSEVREDPVKIKE